MSKVFDPPQGEPATNDPDRWIWERFKELERRLKKLESAVAENNRLLRRIYNELPRR